jgi:hypothetical protein
MTVDLNMDYQSALVFLKDPAEVAQNMTKQVDVAYNFARHRVCAGDTAAHVVQKHDMIADFCTKQLPGPSFRMHCTNFGMVPKP